MDKLKNLGQRYFLRAGSSLIAFITMIIGLSSISKKDWGLALALGFVGGFGGLWNLFMTLRRKKGAGRSKPTLYAAFDITITVLWAIVPFGLVILWQSQLKNGKADRANEGSMLRLISMGFGMACLWVLPNVPYHMYYGVC